MGVVLRSMTLKIMLTKFSVALLTLTFSTALNAACGMSFIHFGQMVCGRQLYWENSYLVIHTRPGERVMRPEFGANWDNLCFAPMTVAELRAMEAHLKIQIAANVGIDVVSVKIVPVEGELPSFEIRVLYLPDGPGQPTDTMIIPFNCGA